MQHYCKRYNRGVKVLSLYLVVFAAGCAMTAYFMSLQPFEVVERRVSSHIVSVRTKSLSGGVVARRGLYISSGNGHTWGRSHTHDMKTESINSTEELRLNALSAQRIPEDFDWRAYLLRYPDLRLANIRNREGAVWHYLDRGADEHRSYAKIPVMLRYTACQGLFNQIYAHLNALIIAEFLGADVVLPPSVYRESFSKYFSMDLKKNQVKWTPTGIDRLIDVAALREHYAKKGIKIYDTPPIESFPDCMTPQAAFPQYKMDDIKPEQIVQLPNIYLQSMHVWYIWDQAAERIMARYNELTEAGWPANTTIVLDLPCPFLSVMTLTCLEEAEEAAMALKFNQTIVRMAKIIIQGMKIQGIRKFNGGHLRLEKDAIDWARALGGFDKYLKEYAKSFNMAGFSPQKHLYIASGLLSYNASREMQDMMAFLHPHSKTVEYKEKYLPPEMLHSLNPEQQALVDFLVLAQSDSFVGLGSSTFSVYLREYRVLLGRARTADVFIDTSKIGTDALFERCTHFAPLDIDKLSRRH